MPQIRRRMRRKTALPSGQPAPCLVPHGYRPKHCTYNSRRRRWHFNVRSRGHLGSYATAEEAVAHLVRGGQSAQLKMFATRKRAFHSR